MVDEATGYHAYLIKFCTMWVDKSLDYVIACVNGLCERVV